MLLGFSANMVVLFNGEVVEFPVPTEERVLEPNTNYICII
jgi:hypothetical protein